MVRVQRIWAEDVVRRWTSIDTAQEESVSMLKFIGLKIHSPICT